MKVALRFFMVKFWGLCTDFVTDQKRSLPNGLGSVECWRLEFGAGAARLRKDFVNITSGWRHWSTRRSCAARCSGYAAALFTKSFLAAAPLAYLGIRNETLRDQDETLRDQNETLPRSEPTLHQHSLNTAT